MPLISLRGYVRFLSLKSTGPFPQHGLAAMLPKLSSLPSPSFTISRFLCPDCSLGFSLPPSVLAWFLPSSILRPLLSCFPPAQFPLSILRPVATVFRLLLSSVLSLVFILSPFPFYKASSSACIGQNPSLSFLYSSPAQVYSHDSFLLYNSVIPH